MTIHVVAAVISNPRGEILLTQRLPDAHQGGLWEFPGGKVEINESAEHALKRELMEEVGLEIHAERPLIRIRHDYPDKSILLDVWRVEDWSGEAWGREGQAMQWCAPEYLRQQAFPAANYPIISAVTLPSTYLITPEPTKIKDRAFFYALERALDQGQALIQLRAKNLYHASLKDYCYFAEQVLSMCDAHHARLLLNADSDIARSVGSHGVHLSSDRLADLQERPLARDYLVAASCHHEADIQQAQALHVDFVVLGAVRATPSHPDTVPLGWHPFFTLTEQCQCPVYALGGMTVADLNRAYAQGAQGIAAIRALWPALEQ